MNLTRTRKRKARTREHTPRSRKRPTGNAVSASSPSLSPTSPKTLSPESSSAASFSSQHLTAGDSPSTGRHRGTSGGPNHNEASPPPNTTWAKDADDVEDEVFTFFTFPGELRNMIYAYSLDYPSSRDLYRRQLSAAYQPTHTWAPRLRAPTILLLCKRITRECLPILHARTLVIDRLPPARFLNEPWVLTRGNAECDVHGHELVRSVGGTPEDPFEPNLFMRLSEFIAPPTLQCVRHIDVNIGLCEGPLGSGWAWRRVVEELLGILMERNMCSRLRLLVRKCNISEDPIGWDADEEHLDLIQQSVEKFACDNPNVFAKREIKFEVWDIEGHDATFASSINYPVLTKTLDDETVVVVDEYGNVIRPPTPPEPRRYPDKEMFPGSVMEFAKAVRGLYRYDNDDSDTDD